jgi:D-xylonolactonase
VTTNPSSTVHGWARAADGDDATFGTDIRLVASGYKALEAPVVDDAGNLYFSDLRGGGVYRLATNGRRDVVVPDRKAVGGICLHVEGGVVVSGSDLSHLSTTRSRVLLDLNDVESKPGSNAVGFNDILADRDGRVFAGVLRCNEGGEPVPGELLLVSGERDYTVVHADVHPNGVTLSADGRRLYLADTFRRRLIVFEVTEGQTPQPCGFISTEDVPGLPDGLATDEDGFVWAAFYRGGCIASFAPTGGVARIIEMPAHKPLSLCFGGRELTELYVVTGTSDTQPDDNGSIYRISLGVRGTRVDLARI